MKEVEEEILKTHIEPELINFMKENGLPLGIKGIFPSDVKNAEQCFKTRGLFKDEDLLIKGWAYLIRRYLEYPPSPMPLTHKIVAKNLNNVLECFLGETVSKIVIKRKDQENINLENESLAAFVETYLKGKDQDSYIIQHSKKYNEMSPIHDACVHAYNVLMKLLIKPTETKIPKFICDIIGNLIIFSNLHAQPDQYNVTNYIERGLEFYKEGL